VVLKVVKSQYLKQWPRGLGTWWMLNPGEPIGKATTNVPEAVLADRRSPGQGLQREVGW